MPVMSPDTIAALELLSSLQINTFLKFVQGRPDAKVPGLCAEKIAAVLNYFRFSLAEVLDQLGESRMTQSNLQARLLVNQGRHERSKVRFYAERISKQKAVVKYIRELMRLSDLQLTIHGITTRARETLQELQLAATLSSHAHDKHLESKLHAHVDDPQHLQPEGYNAFSSFVEELVYVTNALLASSVGMQNAASSSVLSQTMPGAMEIRLPDASIDDEAMHTVMGLLSGVLMQGTSAAMANSTLPDDTDDAALQEDGDDAAGDTTARTNSMLHPQSHSRLAKTIQFCGLQDYSQRILLLNFKGNLLTDLSCQVRYSSRFRSLCLNPLVA